MKKIILLLLTIFIALQLFAQFSATMVFTLSNKQKTMTVFSDVNRYRYEFNEDGQEGVVIVNNLQNEVFVLMPKQKVAMKSAPTSIMSMGTDPLKIYDYYVEKGATEKIIGNEKVNGYDCVKKELYDEHNNLLHTLWFSEKYNFPLKMVSNIDVSGNTEMEINDIKSWIPQNSMFSIPPGYTIMDQSTMMPD